MARGDDVMDAAPQKEHRWLERLVGDWTSETEVPTEPGKAPATLKGTERVRSLGGLWVVAEGEGEMPGGGAMTTVMALGYDPTRKRVVGTFVGSMMTHLWLYEGALDAAERVLTLETEGPSMAGDGTMARYRDTIEFEGDDRRVFTSRVRRDDGTWHAFMTAIYRRTTR
jgi:hypothetical protein